MALRKKQPNETRNANEDNKCPHTISTESAPMDLIPRPESLDRGECSATPLSHRIGSTEKNANTEKDSKKLKTTSSGSRSSSTVSTPSSSDFSVVDFTSVMNRSREYLDNLVCSLESGKVDVDMFVLLIQNIFNGDETLLCQSLDEMSSVFAVGDMIEESVRKLIKKRDDICVDDDETKKQWTKLDLLVAELVLRQESLC